MKARINRHETACMLGGCYDKACKTSKKCLERLTSRRCIRALLETFILFTILLCI